MTEKINYLKPPLTSEEQIARLESRGIIFHDKRAAATTLSHIGYYRLSAYWIPFKKRDVSGNLTAQFQDNITFANIVELYEFDRKLRLLVIDALERIEISIRTNISYQLAHKYGAFALENPSNFHEKFDHSSWLQQTLKESSRSKEPFVEHFSKKYKEFPKLPIWMATEVISFGSLSILYKGLKNEDKRLIAQNNYNLHPKTLMNWLHFLTYIRNICAHHSRLWNKELAIKPKLEGLDEQWLPPITPRHDRSFFVLLILRYLLNHSNNAKKWAENCEILITPILSKYEWSNSSMGLCENWIGHPIWSFDRTCTD